MYKLTYFVNCSGCVVNATYNKRGYDNVSYFATKKEAIRRDKYENVKCDRKNLQQMQNDQTNQ